MYAFNTKLLHIWFIIESYLPHRIWKRYVSKKAWEHAESGLTRTWMMRLNYKYHRRTISKISRQYRKALNYER